MRGTIRRVEGHHCELLDSQWEFCSSPADALPGPAALEQSHASWMPARVPGTVASSLRELGQWSLAAAPRRFDAEDWWFRCRFAAPASLPGDSLVLGFDGLACLAEVWLNGKPLITSDNMFAACEIRLPDLPAHNELLVRFRSLDRELKTKRPRPRWRAPMIENQQIRWFRATLLGRTPGWSPQAAAVGPWRDVWIENRRHFEISASAPRSTPRRPWWICRRPSPRLATNSSVRDSSSNATGNSRPAIFRSTEPLTTPVPACESIRPRCGGRIRTATLRCMTRASRSSTRTRRVVK
jgi:hypothetical protein